MYASVVDSVFPPSVPLAERLRFYLSCDAGTAEASTTLPAKPPRMSVLEREAEIASLTSEIEWGQPQVVFLWGRRGAGKTSLAAYVRAAVPLLVAFSHRPLLRATAGANLAFELPCPCAS